jgi:hypothetical protein
MPRSVSRRPAAFSAGKYSLFRYHPAQPQDRSAINWEAWDTWAKRNGILDKHGNPSYSKVKMLIKHHVLAATQKKFPTFHRINNETGEPIFRDQSRIVVTERCIEQMEWTPEDWFYQWRGLWGRSQGNKARGKRKK